jgi:hypothetical protein
MSAVGNAAAMRAWAYDLFENRKVSKHGRRVDTEIPLAGVFRVLTPTEGHYSKHSLGNQKVLQMDRPFGLVFATTP